MTLPPIRDAARRSISFRAMVADDFDFIESLYISTRLEELALSGWSEEQKRVFLTQQHRAQHHHYQTHYDGTHWLILRQGERAVGRLYLAEWKDQVRIVDISLIPDARGHGFGGALLRDVIHWATGLGKPVWIHVEKNNPARRLYQRLGFTVIEDKGIYDLMEVRPGTSPTAAAPRSPRSA